MQRHPLDIKCCCPSDSSEQNWKLIWLKMSRQGFETFNGFMVNHVDDVTLPNSAKPTEKSFVLWHGLVMFQGKDCVFAPFFYETSRCLLFSDLTIALYCWGLIRTFLSSAVKFPWSSEWFLWLCLRCQVNNLVNSLPEGAPFPGPFLQLPVQLVGTLHWGLHHLSVLSFASHHWLCPIH